jgi:hypothetical protein
MLSSAESLAGQERKPLIWVIFSGERRRSAADAGAQKDPVMNEFEKNQGKDEQFGQQQGDKPAFGQFDKEQGQQEQQEFGQKGEQIDKTRQQEQEQGQGKEAFAEASDRQQGENQFKDEQGQSGDKF